ncbi:MAG: YusW family protein [Bacillota bacterium]|nr:YusW family protein [Bacillota bacterium]MDW7678080.1 YusW family protein [Bacillota bacterium]
MKKRIAIALAVLMVVGIAAVAGGSFADSHTSQITAFINRGISLTWDGRAFEPRETDGSRLYPIVYNGRTYLPATFVADQAGVDVHWDANTQTVIFNSRTINVDLTEPFRDGSTSSDSTDSRTRALENLPFTTFDLEIEGDDDDDELDVDFELYSNSRYKAEVDIELEDRKDADLEGQAALDYLLPIFNRMDIKASMTRQQIVNEVIRAFDWRYGYEEFELEVRFKDGTRIEIEIDD